MEKINLSEVYKLRDEAQKEINSIIEDFKAKTGCAVFKTSNVYPCELHLGINTDVIEP